jgi:hypothetical protein
MTPSPADLDALYPTISLLADLSRTTVGYQKPDLEREAVECYREVTALRARITELEQTPTDAEVEAMAERIELYAPTINAAAMLRALSRQVAAKDALITECADCEFELQAAEAALAAARAEAENADAMREALLRIIQWADAYPEDVFPAVTKEEWKRANAVLDAAGLSLTRISASNMRHVVEGVGKIARMAAPIDAAIDAALAATERKP